jgi:hypothetical protein
MENEKETKKKENNNSDKGSSSIYRWQILTDISRKAYGSSEILDIFLEKYL